MASRALGRRRPMGRNGTVQLRVVAEPPRPPRRQRNIHRRPREYLTPAEVETLMTTARKRSRYGHRDATTILIAYRHGLRVSELCRLEWSQIDFESGLLHVAGAPAVRAASAFRCTRTCCVTRAAKKSPMRATTPAPSSSISATRISATRSATASCPAPPSTISGRTKRPHDQSSSFRSWPSPSTEP